MAIENDRGSSAGEENQRILPPRNLIDRPLNVCMILTHLDPEAETWQGFNW